MSNLAHGRANQRPGLRKADSRRNVDRIAMAAIRSSADKMYKTLPQKEYQGMVEGG